MPQLALGLFAMTEIHCGRYVRGGTAQPRASDPIHGGCPILGLSALSIRNRDYINTEQDIQR